MRIHVLYYVQLTLSGFSTISLSSVVPQPLASFRRQYKVYVRAFGFKCSSSERHKAGLRHFVPRHVFNLHRRLSFRMYAPFLNRSSVLYYSLKFDPLTTRSSIWQSPRPRLSELMEMSYAPLGHFYLWWERNPYKLASQWTVRDLLFSSSNVSGSSIVWRYCWAPSLFERKSTWYIWPEFPLVFL